MENRFGIKDFFLFALILVVIAMIVLSTILPLAWFKWRGWM